MVVSNDFKRLMIVGQLHDDKILSLIIESLTIRFSARTIVTCIIFYFFPGKNNPKSEAKFPGVIRYHSIVFIGVIRYHSIMSNTSHKIFIRFYLKIETKLRNVMFARLLIKTFRNLVK